MHCPLALVLLKIIHSVLSLWTHLIESVDQDHTVLLFQFGRELETSAVVALLLCLNLVNEVGSRAYVQIELPVEKD